MKKLFISGKILVTYVSVFAILAVSILSVFTGVSFTASAENTEGETETTVSYPISGKYDADVKFLEGGISYTDPNPAEKTVVSDFTGFDTTFWLTAEGNGTAAKPFIIKTANQFAAVATNYLVYKESIETQLEISNYSFVNIKINNENTKILDTSGLSFKVADNVKAFNMNNTDSTVDFSGVMTAEAVETAFANAVVKSGLVWEAKANFAGRFDGNGVTVYGLKAETDVESGLFPRVAGAQVRNLTVKNCYFKGDKVGALFGCSKNINKLIVENCSIYNNAAVCTRLNDGMTYASVIIGNLYADQDTKWQSGAIIVSNCLIYGNDFKHSETVSLEEGAGRVYSIENYGLFSNANSDKGATISNSVVLDNAPYSMIYNDKTFSKSTYTNVYTNMIDVELNNEDYKPESGVLYKYKYATKLTSNADGTITHNFTATKFKEDGLEIVKAPDTYTRTYEAGTIAKVDATAITGANAKTAMSGLDWSKWTVNANGYPTPKIYKVREYSVGEPWSGEIALFYTSGDGLKTSPYIISTTEELALMMTTAKAGEYYALGADITINDTSTDNWTDSAKKWFTSNDIPAFEASLDGRGHTVSGIYYDGKQSGTYGGLIPVLGANSSVRNIKITDSELGGNSKSVLGAIAGSVVDNSSKTIKFEAITVKDSVKFDSRATVGGIVAQIGYSAVNITDCISESAGLFSSVTGQANVKRCVSVGAYPFATADCVKAINVYTDTNGLNVDGVTVLENSSMKGDAAKDNMQDLNFDTQWVTTDVYPMPTGNIAPSVKGEVWSGEIAEDFARGTGTENDPYIIETAEQLARCVYNTEEGKKYKLAADIYLNDVNGNLWESKVGCNEWFNQRTVRNPNATGNGFVFDGDGYVVYGLYLNNTDGDEYYRAGLFPYLNEKGTIKNVGLSQACLLGSLELEQEVIGGIVGMVVDWDSDIEMPTHSRSETERVTKDPAYAVRIPVIENCFVDHTCYLQGKTVGGIIATTGGTFTMDNCIFTGSLKGVERDSTSGLIGNDWGFGSRIYHCVSIPLTCDRPAGGASNSDWRSTLEHWCTLAYKTYYFSLYRMYNTYFEKIANPKLFAGENAKTTMDGLDWEEEIGDGGTWRTVEGGTPVLTVFAKHRTAEELEKFSCIGFPTPSTTLSFSTGTAEVIVDDIVAPMYSKITLPTPTREGYNFKGWHTFADLTYLYPYDYQPPRNLVLYAEWEAKGIMQNFENYPNTVWDCDDKVWELNKPGIKSGYKSEYVHKGGKSMHLLGTSSENTDLLLNYEDMLTEGQSYTMTFWLTTDNASNPATLLSLVHNSKPVYFDTEVASEPMAVATGLKVGEWVQYSYSFTAKTKWVSLRATGNSSLYFDDIMITPISGVVNLNNGIQTTGGSGAGANGLTSPNTSDSTVTVAALVSAIMICAVFAVISRKNLVEVIED